MENKKENSKLRNLGCKLVKGEVNKLKKNLAVNPLPMSIYKDNLDIIPVFTAHKRSLSATRDLKILFCKSN